MPCLHQSPVLLYSAFLVDLLLCENKSINEHQHKHANRQFGFYSQPNIAYVLQATTYMKGSCALCIHENTHKSMHVQHVTHCFIFHLTFPHSSSDKYPALLTVTH